MGNFIAYYYKDDSTFECFDEIPNYLQCVKQSDNNFGYNHIYDSMYIRPMSIHYEENYGIDMLRLKY